MPSGFPASGVVVGGQRFYQSFEWRFIITDLTGVVVTWLDRLASDRRVTATLDDALQAVLRVPSDDPRVNIPYTDLDPNVAEGVRCLIGFRHEQTGSWPVRAATLIFQAHDILDGDIPMTEITGWDPWRYIDLLPIINLDADQNAPGAIYTPGKLSQSGLLITSVGDVIIDQLSLGVVNYNDLFIDWGQTAFYTGTFDTIPLPHPISFQNGSSIGQALRDLCGRGWCDIDMGPIYDPANRPGLLAELSLYANKGAILPGVVFAWDRPPRTLTAIDRLQDGTQRANNVQFYHSRGGPPVALQTDAGSVAKFRHYWASRFFPTQGGHVQEVEDLALAQLLQRADTLETITVTPTPERSGTPLLDYTTGDHARIASSTGLRKAVDDFYRVLTIPIAIDDDGVEQVAQLTVKQTTAVGT